MSMSMHVVGFKPADELWKKMKAAFDACKNAGVAPPLAVNDYFDGNDPGDAPGMEVDILSKAARSWKDDSREGFEVDVSALPPGVRYIRFYCSW